MMSAKRAVSLSASFAAFEPSRISGGLARFFSWTGAGSLMSYRLENWHTVSFALSCKTARRGGLIAKRRDKLGVLCDSLKCWHVVCLRGALIKEPFEVGYRLSAASFCLSGY